MGPGDVARDGSPVEIYRALPVGDEPQIIHDAVGEGARILDLGCGTGRIAAPLADLGHAVVGVDDSPAIRARVDGPDLDAVVRYRLGDRSWHQPFTARMRDESNLGALLADSGFAFDRWLEASRGWFVARRGQAAPYSPSGR